MHNVTIDQIEKNKQLIALVKEYPQIYNHNPTLQHSGETLEEVWAKIGNELEEPRKLLLFLCYQQLKSKGEEICWIRKFTIH